ncbi:zinc finger protein [Gigaspora margarita]|uniref:Zinc finger protein n=1 Tax=Gigaspora margarita TaxID=4874 RepID=A0A8H3X228_GIGMA|nr:zinc finger protein [Gigaspora margarita]
MDKDINVLYSDTMIQYMPIEILDKVSPKKVPDIQSIAPDAKIGYALEVDLEAPVHLHNFFADYLLVPEKQIVSENWLSLYNERLVETKKNPIDKAICLKPKMYSVLLVWHDSNLPKKGLPKIT